MLDIQGNLEEKCKTITTQYSQSVYKHIGFGIDRELGKIFCLGLSNCDSVLFNLDKPADSNYTFGNFKAQIYDDKKVAILYTPFLPLLEEDTIATHYVYVKYNDSGEILSSTVRPFEKSLFEKNVGSKSYLINTEFLGVFANGKIYFSILEKINTSVNYKIYLIDDVNFTNHTKIDQKSYRWGSQVEPKYSCNMPLQGSTEDGKYFYFMNNLNNSINLNLEGKIYGNIFVCDKSLFTTDEQVEDLIKMQPYELAKCSNSL